jgi:hypothetical protein
MRSFGQSSLVFSARSAAASAALRASLIRFD